MKKTILAGVVAGMAMSASAFAQGLNTDVLTDGASVNFGVGMADVADLSDSATVVTGGYEKALSAVPGVSVGVDVAMTASAAEDTGVEADYWSVGGYAKYSYDLGALVPNLSANAKVGYAYADYELEVLGVDVEGDETDVVIGAGVAYALDDHTSLTADYVTFDEVDQVTVGVKYAF